MMKRIVKELGILGLFFFLFLFVLGVFSTTIKSHIVIVSTNFPNYGIFSWARSLAMVFFFLIGKSTYFLLPAIICLIAGILFQKLFLTIARRTLEIVLCAAILSGLFSPYPEWLEGGILGNFFNDLLEGQILHIIGGFLLSGVILYETFKILQDLINSCKFSPRAFRKFFFRTKMVEKNAISSESEQIPLLPHYKEIVSKEELSVEEILGLLEENSVRVKLSELYAHLHMSDIFGLLLQQFVKNLYQIQAKDYYKKASHKRNTTIPSHISDKTPLNIENEASRQANSIIEIEEYSIKEEKPSHRVVIEEIIDNTKNSLLDQFQLTDRLKGVFNSLESSFLSPSYAMPSTNVKEYEDNWGLEYGAYEDLHKKEREIELEMNSLLVELEQAEQNEYEELFDEDSTVILERDSYRNYEGFTEQQEVAVESDINALLVELDQTSPEHMHEEVFNGREIATEERENQRSLEKILAEQSVETLDLPVKSPGVNRENIFAENTFCFPSLELLERAPVLEREDEEEKQLLGERILGILEDFNIRAQLDKITVGPVVTRYEIVPPKGLKVSRIVELDDNIALGIASRDRIRIEAPVFGKSVVGIEVPNFVRETVAFRDIVECFKNNAEAKEYRIPFLVGKTLDGEIYVQDLVKTPHLLIAGSTGSGKSVCVNTLINSILYHCSPSEVRLLLVDPKRVELILYDGLPHLISPVIKESTQAIQALKWLVRHMEERYITLEQEKVRNIAEYNQLRKNRGEPIMPYIVTIMDEFADLILLGRKEVEESVIRLAAMARAVGIHLVLATQRPSADVITGLIKANFPSRIAFKVSSKMESRIILDENGAENLLGRGDMLFLSSNGGSIERIQAPLIGDEEVRRISDFFKTHHESQYWDEVLEQEEVQDSGDWEEEDPLFKEAVDIVLKERKTSASYIQRRLKVGYNRAARLIEMMEDMGIIGRANGSRPREILVDDWDI